MKYEYEIGLFKLVTPSHPTPSLPKQPRHSFSPKILERQGCRLLIPRQTRGCKRRKEGQLAGESRKDSASVFPAWSSPLGPLPPPPAYPG